MKRHFFRSNTLLCFSPPVMVATIVIEIALALWVVSRYTINKPRRLMIALLVLLASFQLAEFNVCSSALPDLIWSRLGYVVITMLPAIALHLVIVLRGNRQKLLVTGGYILAISFAAAFAFAPSGLNQGVCTGNYVIFALSQPLSMLYGLYYFGLELVGLILTIMPLNRPARTTQTMMRWLTLAYLAIIVPVLVILVILPATRLGIPSIMCGFAVFFAIILGLKIAPLAKN
jgi:hypothetical protein